MISSLVVSCRRNWDFQRYVASTYGGQKQLGSYDVGIKKADDILGRGINNITETEVYWALYHIRGKVYYNNQPTDRYLFAKHLYRKLQKLPGDSLNNDRLIRMLKDAEWLHAYVIEQGE